MALSGLPDFQQPLSLAGQQIFCPFEGVGMHTLLPTQLEIVTQPNGQLAFWLELIRGESPNQLPAPHGRLAFQLQPAYALSTALVALRAQDARATLTPASLTHGFLRLQPLLTVADLPTDLLQPVELHQVSASLLRYSLLLSTTSAILIAESLAGELLPLHAYVEFEVTGVAPRLPVQVQFEPATLLTALRVLADHEQRISRSVLVAYFLQNMTALPLTITGPLEEQQRFDFAETMVDHIRMRFATFVPAPQADQNCYYHLAEPAEIGQGEFHWDLQIPSVTARPFLLTLNPFTAAHQVVQTQGIDSVHKTVIVPRLPTGLHRLHVTSYLPTDSLGVLEQGVTIFAPANPPRRTQPTVKTAVLAAPTYTAELDLRLAPQEKLNYTATTFLLLSRADGVQKVMGKPTQQSINRLELTLTDYPVTFVPLTATPALLALAALHGRCCWQVGGIEYELSFQLTAEQPTITLLLPEDATEGSLIITATANANGRVLQLDNLPAQALCLDTLTFAEYGPHVTQVTCEFVDATPLAVIELLPEGRPAAPEEITLLRLTPVQPSQEWRWFATSPFQAGYRYRFYQGAAATPGAWTTVASPFAPLTLQVGKQSGDQDMSLPNEQEFQGLRYLHNRADPQHYYYLPDKAGPETDGQGRPTLLLLLSGETALLQLGTRWQADPDSLELLRAELARQELGQNPVLIRLSFAPVTIEKVELLIKGAEGFMVLGTSVSSGAPPYSTLFQTRLTLPQQDLVIAALHGQREVVIVRYFIVRQVEVTVSVTIAGGGDTLFNTLSNQATLDECRAWVAQALHAGHLRQTRTGSELASAALWQQAAEEALEQAATIVHRLVRKTDLSADMAEIRAQVELQDVLALPITRTTDIGDWFKDAEGDAHIRVGKL